MEIIKPSKNALNKAVNIIKNGGVVICPTDTVYGFLVDATNKGAVKKIYKIKKRSKLKPLPLFLKDFKMAKEVAEISEKQAKILTLRSRSGQAKFWPGKVTVVLKYKSKIKLYGLKKNNTVAIRIPNYKFLNDLLKKTNRPLAQTSVNISTKESLNNIDDVIAVFGKNRIVELIINAGNIKKTKPSKIYDFTSMKLTRIR